METLKVRGKQGILSWGSLLQDPTHQPSSLFLAHTSLCLFPWGECCALHPSQPHSLACKLTPASLHALRLHPSLWVFTMVLDPRSLCNSFLLFLPPLLLSLTLSPSRDPSPGAANAAPVTFQLTSILSSGPPRGPFQRPLCCWHLPDLFQVKSLLLSTLLPPCFLPSSLVTAFCLSLPFLPFQHRSQWLHLPQHVSMILLHWCFMKTLYKPKMFSNSILSIYGAMPCNVVLQALSPHPSMTVISRVPPSNDALGFPKPLNCWFSFPSLIWFSSHKKFSIFTDFYAEDPSQLLKPSVVLPPSSQDPDSLPSHVMG